ncbi:hypothetical protein R6Q59_016507 [Mikania micrantha]
MAISLQQLSNAVFPFIKGGNRKEKKGKEMRGKERKRMAFFPSISFRLARKFSLGLTMSMGGNNFGDEYMSMGRVDRLEGMKRWMTERMAASAGMDVPVFPRPGHHQDPAPQEQDPGGHA